MVDYSGLFINFSRIFNSILSQITVASVVLLLGLVLGKLAGKLLLKILIEFELDKNLRKYNIRIPLSEIISSLLSFLIYFVAILIALDILGIAVHIFNLLGILVMLLAILVVVFSTKEFLPNAVAGMSLHLKPGDRIQIDDIEGKIVSMGLTSTFLEATNGDMISVPNVRLKTRKVVKKK